jgi:glycosyltransferase involved in cell wall biosynthesis
MDLRDALVELRERGSGPDVLRVIIVGDSTQEGPGMDIRIRRAYERTGLGWVEFTGALERHEVHRILAGSSILCLPSHWEGFPLSVLEAMASGAAIIATRVGDIPWMIEGAGLLIEPRDTGALADAIERLTRDPEERDLLGKRGRDRVERWFSQARVAHSLYALYLGVRGPRGLGHVPLITRRDHSR